METHEGVVERITFRNPESLYTVARFRSDRVISGRGSSFTVVGSFSSVSPGERFRVTGEWAVHPEYGAQFRVQHAEPVLPVTENGLIRYLGSGMIHGIGPATAAKLVERFGLAATKVIDNEPGRLTEVEGIGPVKAARIIEGWHRQQGVREVMLFLQSHGASPAYAMRIFRRYGQDTVRVIRENPYRLADEVFGVGFKTADAIARQLGISAQSGYRLQAGLRYQLQQSAGEGHIYLPRAALVEGSAALLGVDAAMVAAAVDEQLLQGLLIQDQGADDEPIYLRSVFESEEFVATRLAVLALGSRGDQQAVGVKDQAELAGLSEGQRQAVLRALEAGVFVLTGGPGTGKTTTLNCLIRRFEARGRKVALCAPTGRAAKRVAEATGREAKTVHRLLEYGYSDGALTFRRNERNPLDADAVVVDESSMLDLQLTDQLLRALRPGTKLILVGDADQLPAVGPGSILRDVLASGIVDVVTLTEIFRQARESMIVLNAHRVNRGEFPWLGAEGRDFMYVPSEGSDETLRAIVDLCRERLPGRGPYDPIRDIQVLSPMRRGTAGVDNINRELQEALNPPHPNRPQIEHSGFTFRLLDKVMQVRNNYDREVFNGDVGQVTRVDSEEGELEVTFPDQPVDRRVVYERDELDELVLAYGVSVHKSQGSEYPVVVLPVITAHYVMLQRNLLYTALTRARRLCVLVGSKKALAIAVRNNQLRARHTGLARKLVAAALRVRAT
ncbi:MAG: ATP-dependent RecD-like DNA helicase [Bacillota bacterium]|nr:ATP-dependent RecD-like DNA helicase [Bacillota bacterium]